MKEEKKIWESYTIEKVTERQLKEIKYQDLKEAFKLLGLDGIFKAGKKKDLILNLPI